MVVVVAAVLAAILAGGRIGAVDHFRVFGGHEGLPKFVHDWEYKAPLSGGGAMWDVGIHMTDLVRELGLPDEKRLSGHGVSSVISGR